MISRGEVIGLDGRWKGNNTTQEQQQQRTYQQDLCECKDAIYRIDPGLHVFLARSLRIARV